MIWWQWQLGVVGDGGGQKLNMLDIFGYYTLYLIYIYIIYIYKLHGSCRVHCSVECFLRSI